MNNEPLVSINLAVINGDKYIRRCLESVRHQSFRRDQIEVKILDDGSTDRTVNIIEEELGRFKDFASIEFGRNPENLGMWATQEKMLDQSRGKYIIILSADVIMDTDFVANAVKALNADEELGAVQAKVYQFRASEQELPRTVIDTCGFRIQRSRRVSNIGHGEVDNGQFEQVKEIFGVEGAVPVFRKAALESIWVMGEIADHDLYWYAEDLDVAWRLHLAGWKQSYVPNVIAWHDRATTKSHSHGSWLNYIRRVGIRQELSLYKRQLEWRNTRWTRIKNDYIINILRDLPYIIWREIEVLGYTILFEPNVLKEFPNFVNGIPRMLAKRRKILGQAKASAAEIHQFFA